MKKTAILLGLTLGWAPAGFAADTMPEGDAAAGEAQVAVCSACHGADGNGVAPFPKLAGQGAKYLYKQLVDIRDGARPVPTMVGQLDNKTDQQLADIAAFYAAQTRSGGRSDPELLELGRKVYARRCAGCHGTHGEGGAVFPGLRRNGLTLGPLSPYLATLYYGRPGSPMKAFGQVLGAEELAALVIYQRNAWGHDTGDVVQPSVVRGLLPSTS